MPQPIDHKHITKKLVDNLKATDTDFYIWDTVLSGFAVRVRASGHKSYIVQYRAGKGRGAKTRRVTLGAVGKLTPDQARTAAKRILADVALGKDPAADRVEEHSAPTVSELAAAFDEGHVRRLAGKSQEGYHLAIRRLNEAHGTVKAKR